MVSVHLEPSVSDGIPEFRWLDSRAQILSLRSSDGASLTLCWAFPWPEMLLLHLLRERTGSFVLSTLTIFNLPGSQEPACCGRKLGKPLHWQSLIQDT